MTFIFVGIFAIYTIYEIYLRFIEIKFVAKKSKQKAVVLEQVDYEKAAHATITNQTFEIISSIYAFILLAFWSFFGAGFLQNLIINNSQILQNVLFVTVFLIINLLLGLPLDIYSKFVKDKKLGFSNLSVTLFLQDFIKTLILTIIVGLVVSYLVLFCLDFLGQFWWVYAFILCFILLIAINFIYPTLIAPIFNKMTPLNDDDLHSAINSILSNLGFKSSGIFVIDASKRDSRLNAYFGGLGSSKRVVLFDTLLNKLTKNEILAILGHELGHFKNKDLIKNLALMSVVLFVFFAVFANTAHFAYEALGLRDESGSFLIFFMLYSPVLFAVIEPLISCFSRSCEFKADEFACKVSSKNDMISALKKLGEQNKAFPLSHPIYSFVHHSHPSLYERVKKLESI